MTEARRRLREFAERFAKTAPKAVECLEAGFEDAMAVMSLPQITQAALQHEHAGTTQ